MVDGRKVEVLFVHSDRVQRDALVESLGRSFHILPVCTVQQAIGLASQHRPDAIAVKLQLDRPDDLMLLEQLTISYPAIPLLLIWHFGKSFGATEPEGSAEQFPGIAGVDRFLVIPNDDADRILLALHVLLASEYLPPALQAVMDTFGQGLAHPFLALDHDLRCVYANSAAAHFTRFTPGELIGKTFWDLFPDAYSAAMQQRLTMAAAVRVPDRFEFFLPSRRIWLEQRIFHWRGGISLLMGEVTDRQHIENDGAESKARSEDVKPGGTECTDSGHRSQLLRAFAIELTQTEYRERRRLAQMLHDNLLQLLLAARMRTGMALGRPAGLPAQDLLTQVDSILLESIEMCRSVMFELSPRGLNESGLTTALQSLAQHMQERYGLLVEISPHVEIHVPPEDRILLFEAARELLFNVLKHSGKGTATVSLASKDSRLLLTVEDTGRGFDVDSYLQHSSEASVFGLFSIKQRLELAGGRLEIHSRLEQGTLVHVTLPVRPRA